MASKSLSSKSVPESVESVDPEERADLLADLLEELMGSRWPPDSTRVPPWFNMVQHHLWGHISEDFCAAQVMTVICGWLMLIVAV